MEFLDRYDIRYIRDRGARAAMTTEEVVARHRGQARRIDCHCEGLQPIVFPAEGARQDLVHNFLHSVVRCAWPLELLC